MCLALNNRPQEKRLHLRKKVLGKTSPPNSFSTSVWMNTTNMRLFVTEQSFGVEGGEKDEKGGGCSGYLGPPAKWYHAWETATRPGVNRGVGPGKLVCQIGHWYTFVILRLMRKHTCIQGRWYLGGPWPRTSRVRLKYRDKMSFADDSVSCLAVCLFCRQPTVGCAL